MWLFKVVAIKYQDLKSVAIVKIAEDAFEDGASEVGVDTLMNNQTS